MISEVVKRIERETWLFDWNRKILRISRTIHISAWCSEKRSTRNSKQILKYYRFFIEVQVLRRLKHPNLLNFLGLVLDKENQMCFLVGNDMKLHEKKNSRFFSCVFSFLLDYITGGTLKDIIHDLNIPLSWLQRLKYARDIAAGMVKLFGVLNSRWNSFSFVFEGISSLL